MDNKVQRMAAVLTVGALIAGVGYLAWLDFRSSDLQEMALASASTDGDVRYYGWNSVDPDIPAYVTIYCDEWSDCSDWTVFVDQSGRVSDTLVYTASTQLDYGPFLDVGEGTFLTTVLTWPVGVERWERFRFHAPSETAFQIYLDVYSDTHVCGPLDVCGYTQDLQVVLARGGDFFSKTGDGLNYAYLPLIMSTELP